MTRRWQREMDNADATAKANMTPEEIAAEREAAIRRSDYYDGDAIAWLADVPPAPEPFGNYCECGAWKHADDVVCTECDDNANGEPNG